MTRIFNKKSLRLLFYLLYSSTILALMIFLQQVQCTQNEQDINSLRLGADNYCAIPHRWLGSYFQSGINQNILINESSINVKGSCVETDGGNKFLFYNSNDNCYRCLNFHERHQNILQYKETYCHSVRRPLLTMCSTISGDANLFSMFRLDASPIECPFQGSYIFSYNRGMGECENPPSTLESCSNSSKLLLQYSACPNVLGTESSREILQCLAHWKEGSSRYLLGLLKYNFYASHEERFRCFMYEKINPAKHSSNFHSSQSLRRIVKDSNGDLYRIAQSGDATCNGISSLEGSKILTLKNSMPMKSCTHPLWLKNFVELKIYQSLDRKWSIEFDFQGFNLQNHNGTIMRRADCSQIISNQHHHLKVIYYITQDCSKEYQCVSIYLRKSSVLEIQFGIGTKNAEDACLDQIPNNLMTFIGVQDENRNRVCPIFGHYQVVNLECVKSLSFGCSDSLDSFQVKDHCQNSVDFFSEEYKCLESWQKGSVINLIVESEKKGKLKQRTCFILEQQELPSETAEGSKNLKIITNSQRRNKTLRQIPSKRIYLYRNNEACVRLDYLNKEKQNDQEITFQYMGVAEFKDNCYTLSKGCQNQNQNHQRHFFLVLLLPIFHLIYCKTII